MNGKILSPLGTLFIDLFKLELMGMEGICIFIPKRCNVVIHYLAIYVLGLAKSNFSMNEVSDYILTV